MNISDVAEEIAAVLDTIDGLRCFSYQPATITPPAAWVANPAPGDIEYDQTYGRGMDRMTLPVFVAIGRADNRAAQAQAREYMNGSGPRSIKAVLEAHQYTSCDIVRVVTAGVDGVAIGATEYLAAFIDLDIAGDGA